MRITSRTTIQLRTAMDDMTAHEPAIIAATRRVRSGPAFHAHQHKAAASGHASNAVDRVSVATPPSSPAPMTRSGAGDALASSVAATHVTSKGMKNDSLRSLAEIGAINP